MNPQESQVIFWENSYDLSWSWKKNTFQTVKKLMNNHTQELVIYHFCCLLNIMIGNGFICKYTELLGGGGLIVCISAASSLVSIILKVYFYFKTRIIIFLLLFFLISATTDHLAEGRDWLLSGGSSDCQQHQCLSVRSWCRPNNPGPKGNGQTYHQWSRCILVGTA